MPDRKCLSFQNNTDDFIADTKRLLQFKPFPITIISLVFIQFAYGVIMPVVPLSWGNQPDIKITEAGFIFSLMSLTGALSSALMGGWTERIGVKRMLFWGLLSTAVFLAFQGSAQSVLTFAVLQVMGGLATGAVRPVANTITTYVVSEEDRGKAFGIMTSASALGWAMGLPMDNIGSIRLASVFYATALLFLGVAFWTRWAMRGLVLQGEVVRQRRVGQPLENESVCAEVNAEDGVGRENVPTLRPNDKTTIFSGALAAGKR